MKINNITTKLLLTLLLLNLFSITLYAKDPNIQAYRDRGIKYFPRYVKKGLTKIGKASWYGKPFHRRLTASGERYNMYSMTAAHRTYAMNTILKVTNLKNKKSVKVRVNDRGPFYSTRDIDLSYGAAKRLGITKTGIGRVKIEVLSSGKKNYNKKSYRKTKSTVKSPKNSNSKKHTVQIASFYNKKSATEFIQKQKLKNLQIVKQYIASKKKTAYRVVVKCTPWEAKHLIKSKKFEGAYLLS
ncbi:Rare lipoprotein A precursor [hydrothermal vent metagenome]|uniref:Rare lipoprotein A n=1 Tax=hydrothermal vent metagenome TaxID=652676 RepID=A0A1W1D181_9ZZZZ